MPPYDCFYNVELEQKVVEIYKEDFERYQYVFDRYKVVAKSFVKSVAK